MFNCKTYQINLAFIAPQNLVYTDTLCVKLSPLVYWPDREQLQETTPMRSEQIMEPQYRLF